MIDALRISVETGIKLVDKYFDKVTLEFSDSEDDGEEVEKRYDIIVIQSFFLKNFIVILCIQRNFNLFFSVIFRPKDAYQNRPLPYLIGSKEWHEKWHIGLEEDESDESDNENADEASMSSSPSISVSSNVPVSLSESENPTGVIPPRKSGEHIL